MIIDAHAHIVATASIEDDLSISNADVSSLLDRYTNFMASKSIERSIVYVLDDRVIEQDVFHNYGNMVFSIMLDFRSPDIEERVQRARTAGFRGVKILTYEQEICPADYPNITRMVRVAEELGMFVTICSTFGSKSLYEHDALALASHILQKGFSAPLILAHAGGARAIEAFLLADDAPNVYCDTSFTTTYLKGSRVIEDLVFLVQKLPGRCFFGSDAPYIPFDAALDDMRSGMSSALSDEVERDLLYNNAARFLDSLST